MKTCMDSDMHLYMHPIESMCGCIWICVSVIHWHCNTFKTLHTLNHIPTCMSTNILSAGGYHMECISSFIFCLNSALNKCSYIKVVLAMKTCSLTPTTLSLQTLPKGRKLHCDSAQLSCLFKIHWILFADVTTHLYGTTPLPAVFFISWFWKAILLVRDQEKF